MIEANQSDPDLNLDKDSDTSTIARDGSFEPIWLGFAVSGKEGKISYMVDMIYLAGSYTTARDISAYAFMLRGDYHAGKVGFLDTIFSRPGIRDVIRQQGWTIL